MKRILRVGLSLAAAAALVAITAISPSGTGPQAAEESAGQAAFLANKCQTCHAVPSVQIEAKVKSEKMKGPDLPGGAASVDAGELGKYLRKQAQLDGKDHKKEYKGTDEDLTAIIDWLRGMK